jgi:hypothetical protein
MAQETIVRLTDDIDGSEAAESVTFGLDGVTYSIDLSNKNASDLREQLAVWVEHARKVSGRAKAKQNGSNGASHPDLPTVRAWAKAQGFEVSERGRIAKEVLEAFAAAN